MWGHLYRWCSGDDGPKVWGYFADKGCQPEGYGYALYATLAGACHKRYGTRPSLCFVLFVMSRALQSRLSGQLCREMDTGHDALLFLSELRWLSRGNVLKRVFELRREISELMREDKPDIAEFFSFLADIFNSLNSFYLGIYPGSERQNHHLHGENSYGEERYKMDMFLQLTEFLHTNNRSVDTMREVATSHLTALCKHCRSYSSDVNTDGWDWVRDPFAPAVTTTSGLTGKAVEELLDLSCSRI